MVLKRKHVRNFANGGDMHKKSVAYSSKIEKELRTRRVLMVSRNEKTDPLATAVHFLAICMEGH